MVERTEHYGGGPTAKTSPFVTVAADPPDPSAAPALPLPRGLSRIGRYHVLKTLGEGGMGVVYSAFDEELDRRVAIKVLAADIAPELRGRTRMIREAQAMAKLSHPNVVHVYEVGEVEGHVYVAMEFVRGTTFRQWLDANGFLRGDAQRAPLRERLEIVLQAGEGLAAAHAAGIVHRDFKPENVMVAELPEGASPLARARVLDFGLARGAGEKDEQEEKPEGWHDSTLDSRFPERAGSVLSVQLTKHGSIMGTPAYMSPEQHFGLPTDASSDQFNYCVVLYEALYGVRPFPGDNRMAIAMATRAGK
ncbi:MAG TPA: serine/threonine-protein kinase, partial [Nannocystaceae bacterium]|nr:serine/threonine-protein kinase [Nannocystaceae bacterium]